VLASCSIDNSMVMRTLVINLTLVRRMFLAACIVYSVAPTLAEAAATHNGGLFLYAMNGSDRMVLLADHRKKEQRWAGLGGKFDSKWDSDSLDAAIRETAEETFCAITEAAYLSDPKTLPPLVESGVQFTTYFVQIPLVDATRIEARKKRESFCKDKKTTRERSRFRWVKWANLKADIRRLKSAGKLPAPRGVKSKTLKSVLVVLPGTGNYYRQGFANTMAVFLSRLPSRDYPGW
jgi:hypothetical protein